MAQRFNKTEDTIQLFDHLMGNLPGMAYRCLYNQEYTMEFVSAGCFDLTGWTPEELLHDHSVSFAEIIQPDDRDMVWQDIQKSISTNKPFELSYRITTKDGQIKWVSERGNAIRDSKGRIQNLVGFIHDITREKEAVEELKEREKRLSEIMKVVKTGILLADQHGKILEVNHRFTEITGIPANQIINKNAINLIPKLLRPKQAKKILPIVLDGIKGNSMRPFELNYNHKIIRVTGTKIESRRNLAFFTDITEQKEFEDNIISAKIKAEESDRLKTTFLANMSHEIRTPMNGIVGFTELLRDSELDDEERLRYIDIIHANSEQLLHVINDILDLSRIEAGRLGIFPHLFDPFTMIKTLEDTAKIIVAHKPISIILNYQLPSGKLIESDKNRVQQVLFNLISNAIKFTNKGTVEIGCFRNSWDYIEFYVKDTGIGVPKNVGQRIFERFRQASEGDNRNYGGTGLGLSISKALVNLLGGQIGYTSTEGKGSNFYFTLPDKLDI